MGERPNTAGLVKTVLCISLFTLHFSYAQNRKIDSLNHILKTEKEDTCKVINLNILSELFWKTGKYDTSIVCANSAKTLADYLGYKKGIAVAYNNMGVVCEEHGDYSKAIHYDSLAFVMNKQIGYKTGMANNLGNIGNIYYNTGNYPMALDFDTRALAIDQEMGDKMGISNDFSNIGTIYYSQGNYPKTLEYYFKALAIAQELNDKTQISTNLGNIGSIYEEQGNYAKALEFDLKSLDMDREINDKNGVASNLVNIGNIYNVQKNYPRALDNYFKSLAIYRELDFKSGIALTLGNIGVVYHDYQKNYDSALQYDFQSLNVARVIGDKNGMALALTNIGGCYVVKKNNKLAKPYLDSALLLSTKVGDKKMIGSVYSAMCLLDSATGNYKAGLENFKNSVIYSDSLLNEQNTKKTVQVQMNYDFEQKQTAEKAAQTKKDALAEQERKKQAVIRNAFMGGFALMLALAFFIFTGYREKQRANLVISTQKLVVEQKQKEILDSIHYAQRIQKALLASDAILSNNLPEYFVLYKPKDIVSGDFYWATTRNDKFYLAVCDSTGHGVPGAFMSLLNISFLNEAITEKGITQANEVFNHIRRRLIENVSQDGGQDGMDGVLMAISYQPPAISYVAAYNSPVIVRNNKIIELDTDKMPVGASPAENVSFTHQTFELQKGDTVYLFTDGYTDQFGGDKGKKFMHGKFLEKLLHISNRTMKSQKEELDKMFEEWKGGLEQVDDVLLLGIRI